MRKVSVERRDGEKYYFVRVQRKGKRIRRCTYRDNVADARRVAAELVRAFTQGQYALLDDFSGIKRSATIGEIVAEFRRRTPRGVLEPRSQLDYISALILVVREGCGDPEEERDVTLSRPSDVLSRKLAREFELRRVAAASRGNLEAVKRSVGRYLGQARAVFSRRLLEDYRDAGVMLPESLESFLAYRPAAAPTGMCRPPDESEMRPILDGLRDLMQQDPAVCVIVTVCLYTALRRSEIARMEWSWDHGAKIVIPEGQAKNRRQAELPVAPALRACLDWWRGHPNADSVWVVPSPSPAGGRCRLRAQGVFRRVNQWMRSLGWSRRFTLHGVRAAAGKRMLDGYGLEVAQSFLRHSDPGLTQRRYAGSADLTGKVIEYPTAPLPSGDASSPQAPK